MSEAHASDKPVRTKRPIPVIAVVAAVAWCGGFLTASAPAFGYAKLNAWRAYGETFQLGYVVGFMDAVTLWKYRDPRGSTFPIGGKPKYEVVRDKVNAYFADPANEKRSIVDAMAEIGNSMSAERIKAFNRRAAATPGASSSPGAEVAAPAESGAPTPPRRDPPAAAADVPPR